MSKTKNKTNDKIKKKKIKKSSIIITSLICAVLIVLAAFIIVRSVKDAYSKNELCDFMWVSTSATNASADEVDISEIYNTNYTSYEGTLSFEEDLRFSVWLTPGDPNDGTHSGDYVIEDNHTLSVVYDDSTTAAFEIIRDDSGEITSIAVPYGDYKVYFTKKLQ